MSSPRPVQRLERVILRSWERQWGGKLTIVLEFKVYFIQEIPVSSGVLAIGRLMIMDKSISLLSLLQLSPYTKLTRTMAGEQNLFRA